MNNSVKKFRVEKMVAWRYMRPLKGRSFISVIGLISVIGVTVGVSAIIIVLSVLNGFEHEVKSRFIGFDAHLKIQRSDESPFTLTDSVNTLLSSEQRIQHVSPFIIEKGMITSGRQQRVAMIKGVHRDGILQVTDLGKNRVAGEWDFRVSENLHGLWMGFNMALELEVTVGDTVTVISPSGVMSAFSFPVMRRFVVQAIFKTDMFEYDNAYAFIDLNDASDLFERQDAVDGMDIRLRNIEESHSLQKQWKSALGALYKVDSWYDLHADLYSAMKVEKWGSLVLLSLIILVAGFNIVSTLIMLVMQKTPEIGILRSMGATARQIAGIFIYQGLWVGLFGIVSGCLIGYGICYLQIQYEFIPLPSGIFFIEAVPVKLKWIDFWMVLLVSMILVLSSTVYPARRAADMAPVDALRSVR